MKLGGIKYPDKKWIYDCAK